MSNFYVWGNVYMLFATVSNNEREFIGELYNTYYPCWYKAAYEIVQSEDTAKDMINDTFVKLIKSKRNLIEFDKNALLTFVLKSIRNTCLTYVIKASNKNIDYLEDETLHNIADNISVEDICIRNIDAEVLRTIISKLSDKEQLFIILCFYEGLGDKDIAFEMNMNYNNIRMYRSRLITKIRKMFLKESKVSKRE